MNSILALNSSSGHLFAFSSSDSNSQCFLYHLEASKYPQTQIPFWGDTPDDVEIPTVKPMIFNNDSFIYLLTEAGIVSYDWKDVEFEFVCEEDDTFSKHHNRFPIFYNVHLNACMEYRGGSSYNLYLKDDVTTNGIAVKQHRNNKLKLMNRLKHIVSFGAIVTFHYVDEEDDHQLLFLDVDDHQIYECKHSLGWR
eukprot:20734_1